jgi:hypothetical protein
LQGEPLARSPVSFDGRALAQAEEFRRTFGASAAYSTSYMAARGRTIPIERNGNLLLPGSRLACCD